MSSPLALFDEVKTQKFIQFRCHISCEVTLSNLHTVDHSDLCSDPTKNIASHNSSIVECITLATLTSRLLCRNLVIDVFSIPALSGHHNAFICRVVGDIVSPFEVTDISDNLVNLYCKP